MIPTLEVDFDNRLIGHFVQDFECKNKRNMLFASVTILPSLWPLKTLIEISFLSAVILCIAYQHLRPGPPVNPRSNTNRDEDVYSWIPSKLGRYILLVLPIHA